MKKTVHTEEFVEEFDRMNRGSNFSVAGRIALYEHLTQIEDDIGEEMELDVVALCCEYVEYESFEDMRDDYPQILDMDDDEDDDEMDVPDDWRERLEEEREVIPVRGGGLIIRAF